MGILHTLRKENPGKIFLFPLRPPHLPPHEAHHHGDVVGALKENRHQITVPEETRRPALLAVERMLAVPRD